MRRILVVLLLAILPFQFSWAAAAAYCQHEQGGSTSQHFGHHEHRHDAQGASESGKQGGKLAADMDCAYCHLGCAKPVIISPLGLPAVTLPTAIQVRPSPRYQSHVPAVPERPDRRVA